MKNKKEPGNAKLIGANQYPAVLQPAAATVFVTALKSNEVAERGKKAIRMRHDQINCAVLGYIKLLESAAERGDMPALFDQAHEIRGLAATAGLEASGSIADGLCRYLDGTLRASIAVDPAIVALHVDAIMRAANARDETTRFGKRVVNELSALVAHRLQPVKKAKTSPA